jgi:hypothetical protein
VVTPGTKIPPGKMVFGIPGKPVRDLTADEIQRIHWNADAYVSLKGQYPRRAPAQPAPAPAHPAAPGVLPRYECRRITEAIVPDGSLDEPVWATIPPLTGLHLAHGRGEPELATEVKACWDHRCLYLAFSCKDSDVWATLTAHDADLWTEEVVEVFLSPTGDLRHYYELEFNPLGAVFDAKVFNPEGDRRAMLVDREWHAPGLRYGVRVAGTLDNRGDTDLGWIAEVTIPFADLGLSGPPAPGTVWRANFYRIEQGHVTEYSAWSPTHRDPADFHVPSCFGELVFVES